MAFMYTLYFKDGRTLKGLKAVKFDWKDGFIRFIGTENILVGMFNGNDVSGVVAVGTQ